MKLKFIWIIAIFILALPSINALTQAEITEMNSSIVFAFRHDILAKDSGVHNLAATVTGSVISNITQKIAGNASSAWTASGNNYIDTNGAAYNTINFTMLWWAKVDIESQIFPGGCRVNGVIPGDLTVEFSGTGFNPQIRHNTGSLALSSNIPANANGVLNLYAITFTLIGSVGNLSTWFNGTYLAGITLTETYSKCSVDWSLGSYPDIGSLSLRGIMDESTLFNKSLNSDQIYYYYNQTINAYQFPLMNLSGPAPPATIINNTKPNITINYPSDGDTINNLTYKIQILGNVTQQNGTIQNITINSTNWKNSGNITHFNFTFNGSGHQGLWVLNLSANSTDGNRTSQTIQFTIDTESPLIDKSSISNNRTLFYAHDNVSVQINYSDNIKLFSVNLTTPEGYSIVRDNINQTSYIFNTTFNASTYGIGIHTLTTYVCDAHTALTIDEYKTEVDKPNKKIKFDFTEEQGFWEGIFNPASDKNVIVSAKNPTKLKDLGIKKQKDRYTFQYNKTNSSETIYTFVVTSTEKIEIIGNEKGYNGWLVIKGLNKWIDFNTNSGTNLKYTINRIDEKTVEVTVDGITSDYFEFNSIGDLNCVSKDYAYYLFNYTATYSSTVTETTQEVIKLVIDYANISLNGNGTINYNLVNYNITNRSSNNQLNLTLNFTIPEVSFNQTNVTFFWNFIFNQSSFTTINFTQLVNKIRIALCGAGDTPTLNISIWDENSVLEPLNSDIDALFTIWTNSSTNNVNFTFDLNGQNNYSICIFPNTTINTDADLSYNTTGGFRERWFLRNARLTTNVSILKLYNFNSQSGISTLKGTLKDVSYANYPNLITKLQRRYLTENVYRTVQMDKSDDFGLVLFNVIETSQDYIFIFEEDGQQIDSIGPNKFLCTSGLCDVTFVVTKTETSTTPDLELKSAYNNVSQMYQLNFSDTTGLTHSVQLVVSKEVGGSITPICDTTVAASSGTINCNTTGHFGLLTAEVYTSASPLQVAMKEFISKIIDKLWQQSSPLFSGNELKQELTLWGALISITLIIAGSFVSIVVGIIAYIISLIALSYMGIVNFVSIGMITLSAFLGIMVAYLIHKRQE